MFSCRSPYSVSESKKRRHCIASSAEQPPPHGARRARRRRAGDAQPGSTGTPPSHARCSRRTHATSGSDSDTK
jgi:hypothetical protein